MSLVTLFAGERGFVASRRLVYGPDEIGSLERVHEAAEAVEATLGAERARIAEAVEAAERGGRERGRAAGERTAAAEAAARLETLQRRFDEAVRQQREESVELALEIVRRVAAAAPPGPWLVGLARRAAEELAESAPLVLRVHPDRAAEVREALDATDTPFDELVGDEELGPDDCCIDSRFGRVDVSLEVQLGRIRAMAEEDAR